MTSMPENPEGECKDTSCTLGFMQTEDWFDSFKQTFEHAVEFAYSKYSAYSKTKTVSGREIFQRKCCNRRNLQVGKQLFYFFADNNCRLFYKSPIIETYSYRCALSIFDLFVDNSVAMQHDSIPITREMYRGIIVMVPIRWIGIKCARQSQR